MRKPSAKIIKHSQFGSTELVTMEIELHRFILPEFNTHRVFSRNFQSSRAVPIDKMIEQVRDDPALPVYYGLNQAGMVAEKEMNDAQTYKFQQLWVGQARQAAETAIKMRDMGAHKQLVNRMLEPWMWTKGVVTATRGGFESFFKLRSHKDAQPEIKALSDAMYEALEDSNPQVLELGEWHLPYVDSKRGTVENIKVSTSCCAQVSYRKLDDTLEKAEKIYDMLNLHSKTEPPHFSPTEHVAVAFDSEVIKEWNACGDFTELHEVSGNLGTADFYQYRKIVEQDLEDFYLEDS